MRITLKKKNAVPKTVRVAHGDFIIFKNKMDVPTTVTFSDDVTLRPKGCIKLAAGETADRLTVRNRPPTVLEFTYVYAGTEPDLINTRNGTIRV